MLLLKGLRRVILLLWVSLLMVQYSARDIQPSSSGLFSCVCCVYVDMCVVGKLVVACV